MRAALLAVLLALPAAAAVAPPRRVAVVVEAEAPARERDVFDRLARALERRGPVARYEVAARDLADPRAKGRLLADLAARDLVVPVGDAATELVASELEDVAIYFVDAHAPPGAGLAAPGVRGTFAFSVDDLLEGARALGLTSIGVLTTPGYEPVLGWIRAGAASRGLTVHARVVDGLKDLPAAARALFTESRAVWVVGDPSLSRGAGLEFVVERSLSVRVPLIMGGEPGVRRGALLGYEASAAGTAEQAARDAAAELEGRDVPRLRPAPRGGELLLNAALAERWGLAPPGALHWRRVR